MKATALLLCILLAGCSKNVPQSSGPIISTAISDDSHPPIASHPSPRPNGDEVGNGGDFIRILMEEGRLYAAEAIHRIHDTSYPSNIKDYLEDGELAWLISNKGNIEEDIRKSEYVWTEKQIDNCPKDECGCAFLGERKIYFSISACSKTLNRRQDSAKLLIHESMHHFVGSEETKAKRLGVALYSAWYNMGHPDSPHWKIFTCPGFCQSKYSVWTGSELMMWDEWNLSYYNPSTDSWRFEKNIQFPSFEKVLQENEGVSFPTPVWMNDKAFMFVGSQQGGFSFDSQKQNWTTLQAPPLKPFDESAPISTGKELIFLNIASERQSVGGQIYSATSNRWSIISNRDIPLPRTGASVLWAGDRLLLYGGNPYPAGGNLNSGAMYNIELNKWTAMSSQGAPSLRRDQRAVWTGTEMVVYGGFVDGVFKEDDSYLALYQTTGAAFNPKTNTWRQLPQHPIPHIPQKGYLAGYNGSIWTGTEALFFGPSRIDYYNPYLDNWDTSQGNLNYPDALNASDTKPVWTGMEMIYWDSKTNTGYLFYP